MKHEYLRLEFDFGDLTEVNFYGEAGWRVVSVQPVAGNNFTFWALLERSHKATS